MQTLVKNQVINPLVLGFSALIITTIAMTLITLKNQDPLHYGSLGGDTRAVTEFYLHTF
jgi:ABC-type enterochelin transport system permease subunit